MAILKTLKSLDSNIRAMSIANFATANAHLKVQTTLSYIYYIGSIAMGC